MWFYEFHKFTVAQTHCIEIFNAVSCAFYATLSHPGFQTSDDNVNTYREVLYIWPHTGV